MFDRVMNTPTKTLAAEYEIFEMDKNKYMIWNNNSVIIQISIPTKSVFKITISFAEKI